MSKHSLLLVDGDTRSLRVLEVSLRKAGFTVTSAQSMQDALDKLELGLPDLIISETKFEDGDGFELRRRVRATQDWAEIPFVFLTAEAAIENKIRGLELGVDDYLTKPIYIKEIVARINILLQKRQRARFEERRDGRMRFAGRVADMPVVDVIQTIEISRKSGVIQFSGEHGRQGAIYFRDGKVIDAEAGSLQGEDAVYRLLTWSDGEFEVVFRTVRRRDSITTSSQGLLMEGMRRLDEWSRLLEQLPPLGHRFEVDVVELATRLGEVPDDNNQILRLIDGKRSLIEAIDACDFSDLECLQAISRLYFEGLLIDLDHGAPARRDTGKPMPLVVIEEPLTPMEESASGPIPRASDDLIPTGPTAEDAIPTEMMSGFRSSSLRLIDEAVAAADLIEPSMYDGPAATDALAAAQAAVRVSGERAAEVGDAHAVPEAIPVDDDQLEDEEKTPVPKPAAANAVEDDALEEDELDEPAAPPPVEDVRSSREESGLRMIGSLGRDRAEASGELVPVKLTDAPPRATTQRELVTILPRRITRELEAVKPVEPDPEPEAAAAAAPPPAAPPVEQPRDRTSSSRIQRVPTGTRRRTDGPSTGAILLLMLAGVLTILAVYTRLKRHDSVAGHDAGVRDASVAPRDGAFASSPIDAGTPPVLDAGVVHRDAGTAAHDAARADAGHADAAIADAGTAANDAGVDPHLEAKRLTTEAKQALDEGEADKALELADRALKLRRTVPTLLVRGSALQRLGRTDDAIAAINQAIKISDNYAPSYDQLGRTLWAARRYDEARTAFQKYLDLAPNGPSAAEAKRRLSEPK